VVEGPLCGGIERRHRARQGGCGELSHSARP
jgi:hypothetical protein